MCMHRRCQRRASSHHAFLADRPSTGCILRAIPCPLNPSPVSHSRRTWPSIAAIDGQCRRRAHPSAWVVPSLRFLSVSCSCKVGFRICRLGRVELPPPCSDRAIASNPLLAYVDTRDCSQYQSAPLGARRKRHGQQLPPIHQQAISSREFQNVNKKKNANLPNLFQGLWTMRHDRSQAILLALLGSNAVAVGSAARCDRQLGLCRVFGTIHIVVTKLSSFVCICSFVRLFQINTGSRLFRSDELGAGYRSGCICDVARFDGCKAGVKRIRVCAVVDGLGKHSLAYIVFFFRVKILGGWEGWFDWRNL